jgi:hypothetical protein
MVADACGDLPHGGLVGVRQNQPRAFFGEAVGDCRLFHGQHL